MRKRYITPSAGNTESVMDKKNELQAGAVALTSPMGTDKLSFLRRSKRWFNRSSRSVSKISELNEETTEVVSEKKRHFTMKRSKSEKTIMKKPMGLKDKSATLPSPRTELPSPVVVKKPQHLDTNQQPSSPKRQPNSYHSPITIGSSISPPHFLPHSNRPSLLQQAASSWDISPCTPTHQKKLVRSSSISDSSFHDYSEPYHWLVAAPKPPPLPPRPPQFHQQALDTYIQMRGDSLSRFDMSMSLCNLRPKPDDHDYMSISSLTLNNQPDASDYQQPIVTQRTPLPPCIKHRKIGQPKDTSPEAETTKQTSPPNRKKFADRRITVVILDDHRTIKV